MKYIKIITMEFKDRLRELRTDQGILQKDLAKYLNVSNTTVSEWERGNNQPDIKTLIAIAKYFNTSVDYLIGYETEDGNKNTDN